MAAIAQGLEHPIEPAGHVPIPLAEGLHQIRVQRFERVTRELPHQRVATSEMMQDRRVRDPEVRRDVLESDLLGPALGEALLGRLEDGVSRFFGGSTATTGILVPSIRQARVSSAIRIRPELTSV